MTSGPSCDLVETTGQQEEPRLIHTQLDQMQKPQLRQPPRRDQDDLEHLSPVTQSQEHRLELQTIDVELVVHTGPSA